jgi:hypothetical protein
MHPKRPESRSSQLPALISHLGALISHLTLPQVPCQISRRRRRRGPVRGMQQRDLLLHHGCPRAPLPHRLPSGRVLWAPQGKTQVPGELFDQRDADADACPGGGLAAIRRNRAAFGFGRLPAGCLYACSMAAASQPRPRATRLACELFCKRSETTVETTTGGTLAESRHFAYRFT